MMEDWPEDYKQYLKQEQIKIQNIKKRMLENGWLSVSIEPNIKTLEEFLNQNKDE